MPRRAAGRGYVAPAVVVGLVARVLGGEGFLATVAGQVDDVAAVAAVAVAADDEVGGRRPIIATSDLVRPVDLALTLVDTEPSRKGGLV